MTSTEKSSGRVIRLIFGELWKIAFVILWALSVGMATAEHNPPENSGNGRITAQS